MQSDFRMLTDFIGTWTLEKTIQQAGGDGGSFQGQAVWTRDGQGAMYEETGYLTLGGGCSFPAMRRYRWTADLAVYFDDGRFFHTVPAAGGEAKHWCDPDQYDVMYDFASWPAFEMIWRVTGPAKDYSMRCLYTRW